MAGVRKPRARKRARRSGEAGVSPEAIEKATGQPWTHWTRVLDRFDVRSNGHKAAARHLLVEHGASPWWSQMLTVRYELEHGLRQPLQRGDKTFAVTVQRTIHTTPAAAWNAWTSRSAALKWLPGLKSLDARPGGRIAPLLDGEGEFSRIDRHERLRIIWRRGREPAGMIEVRFASKPGGRVTIGVGHSGISGKREAEQLKSRWTACGDALRNVLHGA
ncbi:MAG: SRPBCC domain-containing protein [Phycisphaerales bacterium]|nr:SRPBCC domain-containing protein [Phycisphaerales bacterium]